MVIAPHNLKNKFQPLDFAVNKGQRLLPKISAVLSFQTKLLIN